MISVYIICPQNRTIFYNWTILTQKLKPLFAKDGKYKKRKWTFANIIQALKQITKNKISLHKMNFTKISNPTDEQQQILDLLEIKL